MFTLTRFTRIQRLICMLTAALIVAVMFSNGMSAVRSAAHPSYSVTIVQLQ